MRALLLLALSVGLAAGPAGATWSIVAVDSATREVGIAAASCIGGVEMIAGLAPGHGVVAAQALSSPRGRERAVELLTEGASPEAVLDAIADADFDRWQLPLYELRQYGVAALGHDAKAFTGRVTSDWKGSLQDGPVSVQGNLLYGPEVVQAAFAAYQAAAGRGEPLARRLMFALEAGAAQGGDRRCPRAQSALSALLFVARPDDPPERPSLRLRFPDQPRPGLPSLVWEQTVQFWKGRRQGFADAPLAEDELNPVAALRERFASEARSEPQASEVLQGRVPNHPAPAQAPEASEVLQGR